MFTNISGTFLSLTKILEGIILYMVICQYLQFIYKAYEL